MNTQHPDAFYWQWMELIEKNTERLARRVPKGAPKQQELHIPSDPELYYYLCGGE
jgi:hypothetical protein